MVTIDRVPEWLRLAGLAAYDRREPTVRVAHLDHDSLMQQRRDVDAPRILRFTTDDHLVTVTVSPAHRAVSLTVTVRPAGALPVDVRPLHGQPRRIWTDPAGTAMCLRVPRGPVSLLVRWPAAEGGPVRTAWTQV